MRCPKCHYLSFDPEPRCKNCGYDLEVADAELALRTTESVDEQNGAEDLPELTLRAPERAAAPITLELVPEFSGHDPLVPASAAPSARLTLTLDEPVDRRERLKVDDVHVDEAPHDAEVELREFKPVVPAPRAPHRAPHTTTDLPLFVKRIPEPEELPPSLPSRPPLGVRRAAPEPVRPRPQASDRRLGPLDRDLLEDLKRVERDEAALAREAGDAGILTDSQMAVPAGKRAAAVAVDTAVLGGIAAFVFWATLRVCDVSLSDLSLSALVPLLAFLVLMDVGYLLMFTAAGGQTVGKMLMHIRVVGQSDEDGGHLTLEQAAWRAALSVIGLGLGWLPALFGSGLALHDRLAHTRVVRA